MTIKDKKETVYFSPRRNVVQERQLTRIRGKVYDDKNINIYFTTSSLPTLERIRSNGYTKHVNFI